jgi:flagellar biosynthesis protein FlhF
MLLTKLATFKPLAELLIPGKAHIFIGPHGAGKTTLVAKLAVHFHKQGFPVGLLSLDDEKIGGMEPLAVVAESLGDRAHLVTDLTTLRAAATQMGARHMLLIDTPGINPYQPGTLAKLEDRLTKLGLPATVHLVAPANLGHDDMTLLPVATQRFAPTSLAITRLDAASRFGGLFTTAADSGLPLGLASHSPALSIPPLPLTAPWLAQTLAQYPTQPWELPA